MECDCGVCKTCKHGDEIGEKAMKYCEACIEAICPKDGQGDCDGCKWEARDDES